MSGAIIIIMMNNCNDVQVHRCIECTRALEAAKDQGSSKLRTFQVSKTPGLLLISQECCQWVACCANSSGYNWVQFTQSWTKYSFPMESTRDYWFQICVEWGVKVLKLFFNRWNNRWPARPLSAFADGQAFGLIVQPRTIKASSLVHDKVFCSQYLWQSKKALNVFHYSCRVANELFAREEKHVLSAVLLQKLFDVERVQACGN